MAPEDYLTILASSSANYAALSALYSTYTMEDDSKLCFLITEVSEISFLIYWNSYASMVISEANYYTVADITNELLFLERLLLERGHSVAMHSSVPASEPIYNMEKGVEFSF